MNSLFLCDAYKQSHREQYPKGTNLVYSNWTARSDKHAKTKDGVVVFGIQSCLMKIKENFDKNFFNIEKQIIINSFKEGYKSYFGEEPGIAHVEALHDLGYLPIIVKALPEGNVCPIGVPMLTIQNSLPEFFWITNFLETIISTELWQPMTSATIAREYKKVLSAFSEETCDNNDHLPFQAHDFSMRGMAGLESASASGAGHLLSFAGSDTIPAVYYLEKYYKAKPLQELVGCSIPATEHSVMSMGTKEDEIETFRRLITETYPSGLVSIVSDTWDLWKVLNTYLPELKDEILNREGKVVIRPDSGNPVDIICGTDNQKGVIELLWDFSSGEINNKGYKVLDPRVGAIYGDSITLERADEICKKLKEKGFASSNIVFGLGSYTYQYNTRDTYGFAMKATYGEVNGIGREIFKDPITDDGTKKSLKGLLMVSDGKVKDGCTREEESTGDLKTVFFDGVFTLSVSFNGIKGRLNA